MEKQLALDVIKSLRSGTPPQRGTEYYSVGNEKLIGGIKRFIFSNIEDSAGQIHFVNGSWGTGKTHLFRQLKEISFKENCLVSNVELGAQSAMLNKFETVFSEIIQKITSPAEFNKESAGQSESFGTTLLESLYYLGRGCHEINSTITPEECRQAEERLMAAGDIDLDFRKMVKHYWQTWSSGENVTSLHERRGKILQWFMAKWPTRSFGKEFEVATLIKKENARSMLQSLTQFAKLAGYKGLVLLFDEAEQSYSAMSRMNLTVAQSNLLHLINSIDELQSMLMIYATTPDFFNDEKHGIIRYGALAGRIGSPDNYEQPRALDKIWNLDYLKPTLEIYQQVALKIRDIYIVAYGDEECLLIPEKVNIKVSELYKEHPHLASASFWRVMIKGLTRIFDSCLEDDYREEKHGYADIMNDIREK